MTNVSILIPSYNAASYISETVESCLSQTYDKLEIVIVDDSSKDRTYEIAKSFESDRRVKVYRQPSSGACRARNHAFEKCSGDYCIYLDADDVISPNFVESHLALLKEADDDCVSFCPWDRFCTNIKEATFPHLNQYKQYEEAFQLLLDMWNNGNMLQTACYMVPRKLIVRSGGWDESVLKNQDGEFFSRILMLANKAYFVPDAKVYYRSGDYLSVSKASSKAKVASMLDTFVNYRKNALAKEDSERVRKALAVNFTLFMYIHGNQFPDLMQMARKEVKALGVGYQLNTQPQRVRQICKYVPFEWFLWVRKHFLHR